MLAIIIDHYHLRNDVRLLADTLSTKEHVIFLAEPSEIKLISSFHTAREMKSLPTTFKNRLLKQLYFYFGNLPKIRKNYRNYIIRRSHSHADSPLQRISQKIKVTLQVWLPDLVSFDQYINAIDINIEDLEGITRVLSFTDINNENMIANILRKKIPLYTYVHSWDHLAKFRRFSREQIHYITWSSALSKDMELTHGISKERTSTLAASQYTFIDKYFPLKSKPGKENFFYYVASFGYPKLVKQELLIVKAIAKTLGRIDPSIKLVFRPYPVLKDWAPYEILKNIENIEFDDFEKHEGILLKNSDMDHKIDMIQKSIAVLHCGTTIGLEASYFDTPVIYLCPEDIDYRLSMKDLNHIFHAWNQFHLKRYYQLPNYKNVVTRIGDLEHLMQYAITNPEALLDYNRELRKLSPLISMDEFVARLDRITQAKTI